MSDQPEATAELIDTEIELAIIANSDRSIRTSRSTLPFGLDWIVHFNDRLAKLPKGSPLIFMISSQQPQFAAKFRDIAKRVPMIKEDKVARSGIIIVGNAPGSRGCHIDDDGRDLSDLISWAEANDAQNEFTLVGVAGKGETTIFPSGLENDELSYCVNHVILDEILNENDIHDALDKFSKNILNASDIDTKLWFDRNLWIPVTRLEKCIQDQLMIFFRGRFVSPSDVILQEINNPDGRCDLLIKSKHLDVTTTSSRIREFVLELKALKSFTEEKNEVSAANHEAALLKGMQQAKDYKDTMKPEFVFLCVFDLRKNPSLDLRKRFQGECDNEKVEAWWDSILPNTEFRRKAKMVSAGD